MKYQCPMPESTPVDMSNPNRAVNYVCGRPATHLVQGTVICSYHALKLELRVNDKGQLVATN